MLSWSFAHSPCCVPSACDAPTDSMTVLCIGRTIETCRGQGLHGLRGRALQVGAAQAVGDPLQALELALDLWRNVRRRRDLPFAAHHISASMQANEMPKPLGA